MNKSIIEYLQKTKNPYSIEIGDVKAELSYSKNNKSFKECILNIVREKRKKN